MLNGVGDREVIEALRRALAAGTSKPAEIAPMVTQVEAAFGSVDILVNNADVQFVAPVDEFPDAKWAQIIGINLSSNFDAIKAALPGLKAHDMSEERVIREA